METCRYDLDATRWAVVASLLVLGCGCASKAVRFDETGAHGHRAEAAKELAAAQAHRRQFDPEAVVPAQPIDRVEQGVPVMDDTTSGTNPTAWHLSEAGRHAAHAQAHSIAAEALERFEASECAAIAPRERNACPLLTGVAAVSKAPRGVRIDFRSEAKLPRLLVRMRCHLAYARAVGFEHVSSCPLYMRGVDILPSADGRAIEVVGEGRATIEEIRRTVDEAALRAH